MELLSFMQLFGFKISALAEQLGIDERTLALVDPEAGLRMIAVASKKKNWTKADRIVSSVEFASQLFEGKNAKLFLPGF